MKDTFSLRARHLSQAYDTFRRRLRVGVGVVSLLPTAGSNTGSCLPLLESSMRTEQD